MRPQAGCPFPGLGFRAGPEKITGLRFRAAGRWAFRTVCIFWACLVLVARAGSTLADETPTPTPAPLVQIVLTNSEELLQAIQQVQSQVQSNQVAIERNERQISATAEENSQALSNGLKRIESNFAAQQEDFSARNAQDLQTMQSSNRSMLLVAGVIASIAFLGMLISGFFQWRTSKVWGEISAMLPSAREALRVSRPAEVTTTGAAVNLPAPIGDINVRLLGAIEQLEKRIQRLEQGPEAALRIAAPEGSATGPAHPTNASTGGGTAAVTQSSATAQAVQISALLNQGQTCLKENDLESALRFFEQALSLNPNEAEVLVKKGVTLERMQRPTEAIDCYDRAIAANAGMTSAYLRKGSLYNRAERFKDALECYEQALQAQEESGH